MSEVRLPHWAAGPTTKAVLADREAAERFAHITYGELVKHFGLGSTHTFSSWRQLPSEEQEKWVSALTEVQVEVNDVEQQHAEKRGSRTPSH